MKDKIRLYKDNIRAIERGFNKTVFNSAFPKPYRLKGYKVAEKVEKMNRVAFEQERRSYG